VRLWCVDDCAVVCMEGVSLYVGSVSASAFAPAAVSVCCSASCLSAGTCCLTSLNQVLGVLCWFCRPSVHLNL
jgi:hypothetical protein